MTSYNNRECSFLMKTTTAKKTGAVGGAINSGSTPGEAAKRTNQPPKHTAYILTLSGIVKKDLLADEVFDEKFMAGTNDMFRESILTPLPATFTGLASWPKRSNLKCWECAEYFNTVPLFIPTNPTSAGIMASGAEYLAKNAEGVLHMAYKSGMVYKDAASTTDQSTSESLSCNQSKRFEESSRFYSPMHDPNTATHYNVLGNFCSWACIARWIESNHDKDKVMDIMLLVRELHYIFTGIRVHKIYPGPSRTLMREYCGDSGITKEEFRTMIRECDGYIFMQID